MWSCLLSCAADDGEEDEEGTIAEQEKVEGEMDHTSEVNQLEKEGVCVCVCVCVCTCKLCT